MPPLEIARLALLVTHFLGLAALIGPFLLQTLSPHPPRLRLMLTGAAVQLVTGNALIASHRLQGLEVDEVKMLIKLGIVVVALGVLIAAILVQRRRGEEAEAVRPLFRTAGGLAIADVLVAVAWT